MNCNFVSSIHLNLSVNANQYLKCHFWLQADLWEAAIDAWYSEVQYMNQSLVEEHQSKGADDNTIGHYTQVIAFSIINSYA